MNSLSHFTYRYPTSFIKVFILIIGVFFQIKSFAGFGHTQKLPIDTTDIQLGYLEWPSVSNVDQNTGDMLPKFSGGYEQFKEDMRKDLDSLLFQFDLQQKNMFESKLVLCMDVDSAGKTKNHFTQYTYGRDLETDSVILGFARNIQFAKPAMKDGLPVPVKIRIPIYIHYPGNGLSIKPMPYPEGDFIWTYNLPETSTDTLIGTKTDATLYYFRIVINDFGEIMEYKLENVLGEKNRQEIVYAKRMIKSIHHFKNQEFEPFQNNTIRILLFRFENNRIQTVLMRPQAQF